ncbi:CgeB family protein [Anaerocolumna sp. MB42-C2]|uniref:CgeB family protein n=1 Tax=Anaerocolumna sp. MB42-C2 TaxID=3070997 RepID=UPI0027E13720|nr:glycosyltransferase [Anaerocolumna sp. MB42-C2]WMJ89109.1 glycosyltransferase [Anaerocolumna sp. MB42-C2]
MYKILTCVFSPQVYNEIHNGFLEAGCEVRNILIGEDYINKFDSLKTVLTNAIEEFKPDFVYSYGWWKDIVDINEFFDLFKKKGLFHVWWSADDPVCCGQVSLPAAKRADLVFTPVDYLIPEYEKFGIEACLQPNACAPRYIKLPPKPEYKKDVVFLGNNYSFRHVDAESKKSIFYQFRVDGIYQVIKPLVDKEKNLKVWGRWWTDFDRAYILPTAFYGGILPVEEIPYVYSSAKIALGIQQVATSKTYVSTRTYEALGCGAFHITQYSQGVEYYFKKGVHLEWSNSAEEILELVDYYLTHENEMEKIALNGQREVNEKHRLVHRARTVMDTVAHYI